MRRGKRAATEETKRKANIIANSIVRGETAYSALRKAGFSESSSHKGLSATFRNTPNLAQAVKDELDRWLPALQVLPVAQVRGALVRQRLLMNLLEGKDRAVQSAKLLGQDREVNMFEPETRIGIQVAVQPPADWRSRYILEEPDTAAENVGAEGPEARQLTKTR